ncbi:MAG: hypothetical protein K8T20_13695 [Planctomycetes bacterium]|nr:hypothetical protein [Planctomycetota bacterium]
MISLRCSCGKKLHVPDTMAGKKGKCPGCGASVAVPRAGYIDEDGDEVAEDLSALELEEAPAGAAKSARPVPQEPPKTGEILSAPVAAPEIRKAVTCPVCGERYPGHVLACARCAIDLATGKPLAGVVPGRMSAPRPPGDDARTRLLKTVARIAIACALAIALVAAAVHFFAPMRQLLHRLVS